MIALTLPLLCFALLMRLCWIGIRKGRPQWRECFLTATVLWGTASVLGTEGLSLMRALDRSGLLLFWATVTLALLAFNAAGARRAVRDKSLQKSVARLKAGDWTLLGGTALIITVLAIIAWQAPPNTWDSMTYHMSRVMHWIQNRSLVNYPTNIPRQISYTPGAEYLILHLHILTGSDRLANFVQWFSMVGCVIGSSMLAAIFGAGHRGQILAAVLAATIPMGILQSTSTQNDYVAALWLICFAVFALLMLTPPPAGTDADRPDWNSSFPPRLLAVLTGCSCGLALLTKGTGLLYAVPFALWWLSVFFRQSGGRQGFKWVAVIGTIVVLLNAGYTIRRTAFHLNTATTADVTHILVGELSLSGMASGILRNASLHLSTPFTDANRLLDRGLRRLHDRLLPRSFGDPATTFGGADLPLFRHPFHEDQAGNLLHLLLFIASAVILTASPPLRHRPWLLPYGLILLAGFFIVSVTLRWTLFHSRYHLPWFILGVPFAATVLEQTFSRRILLSIGIVFLGAAVPWVINNQSRPLVGEKNILNTPRREQYFANNPGFIFSYQTAMNDVAEHGCTDVGLLIGEDSWEYPLWVLRPSADIRLRHVTTDVPGHPSPPADTAPCAIIADPINAVKRTVHSQAYVQTRALPFLQLFYPDPSGELWQQAVSFYVHQALTAYRQAENFAQQHQATMINDTVLTSVQERYANAVRKAGVFDWQDLNRVYAGFGDHWREEFQDGLSLMAEGLRQRRPDLLQRGQGLLQQWQAWFAAHQTGLQEALQR